MRNFLSPIMIGASSPFISPFGSCITPESSILIVPDRSKVCNLKHYLMARHTSAFTSGPSFIMSSRSISVSDADKMISLKPADVT